MKHRVRQAVFNRIDRDMEGKHAIDLFAGSGALGLEAISRGAAFATLIECHVPTAKILCQNVSALDVQEHVHVLTTSAFLLAQQPGRLPAAPWLVFCSPPYDFYVDRQQDMIRLIGQLIEMAPAASVFVVEADKRFDFSCLPRNSAWEIRTYPPAVVAILRD
jgi:16S rRNA (guanine966-N2)-methyltransferase